MRIEYHSPLRAMFGGKLPNRSMMLQLVMDDTLMKDGFSWKREALRHEFSWAIPNDKALTAIARHGPVVELGAGGGYWAYLLAQRGIDVVALDRYTNGKHPLVTRHWVDVQFGNVGTLRQHADRTLFLCWPPHWNHMADNALRTYRGDTLVYVGESNSGCTSTERFHDRLDRYWEEIGHVAIPQWPWVHDTLSVYQRKGG